MDAIIDAVDQSFDNATCMQNVLPHHSFVYGARNFVYHNNLDKGTTMEMPKYVISLW